MTSMPPVPPASRTPHGGTSKVSTTDKEAKANRHTPGNLDEQDRQGNIHQNTTHQGYQQDR